MTSYCPENGFMDDAAIEALQERTRERQRAELARMKAAGTALLSKPVNRRACAVVRAVSPASPPLLRAIPRAAQ